jgi:hypothetical protein
MVEFGEHDGLEELTGKSDVFPVALQGWMSLCYE